MRQAICYISLCAVSFAFSGCGQSGALQLPNDPNYDKRAKYLLYSNAEAPQQVENKIETAPVQQPAATENSSSTTTP